MTRPLIKSLTFLRGLTLCSLLFSSCNDAKNIEDVAVEVTHRLEWGSNLSPKQMDYEEAQEYAAYFSEEGWRLPTKKELNRMSLRELLLNAKYRGYLMSGTELPNGGYYVMNIRNAHVFNGKGNLAYVRLVRELPK